MKKTEAEGIFRGLGGYHLAGYAPRYDATGAIAEHIPFVLLSTAPQNRRKKVRTVQDRIAISLVRSANY
jgi:hypothetical protein